MLGIGAYKQRMPRPEDALPGRAAELPLRNAHHVHGRPLRGEFPGLARVAFGMGCFWGAERKFWPLPGVETTAVGYAGGYTPHPTYREVCSGLTGHAEVVLVVYDPARIGFDALLRTFWENHDPTQGMRQGNDVGTQYRSVIHCHTPEQHAAALASRDAYQQRLRAAGYGAITTEIAHPAPPFYYAEDEHQQYLSKNPLGYCGLGGTGVGCPLGLAAGA
ncbi:peptide-methionine (S)-S-oxide reductase MsrA [Vulcaniibacterium tengchongense]|uniref:Peptide methionine sulfoxide reductase MsrA n=1 Tax=Vulcaniibacterium tengchongense TaxID=1273429 RepID=A0A3N4UZZ5_9GAMM|nr:peptide-methionine (S)-S-oxide reductase MsrA [Vulcaniibacterium tengchongense]RPE75503.1 peptide-methionine (S)-S-oxide reductase [Vulcaniibacterium tengchongense]